jgi:glycosyltransferase involved in cell wall biosynthesis
VTKKVLFFRPTLGEGGADRVQIAVLRGLDRARYRASLVMLRNEGPFAADVPADVAVIELGSRRLASSLPALARTLIREKPDVVVSLCSASNVILSSAHMLVRSKARLVLSERNALYRGRSVWHAKQTLEVVLKRLLYRHADLVTAVSEGVADELAQLAAVPRDKIAVVYNPMVDDEIAARAAEPVEHPWFRAGEPPVVLACARLVPQKDYPTLLAAFARLRRDVTCRLWILGEGPLRGELEALAVKLGVGDDVHFAGFDKNPFRFMARACVLMHASRAEGLPGSLIQAMACGTPVVSTDCDFGPREVITTGRDGYLVPIGDVEMLAARVRELLVDRARRDEFGIAAVQSVERFRWDASIARYQAALEPKRQPADT